MYHHMNHCRSSVYEPSWSKKFHLRQVIGECHFLYFEQHILFKKARCSSNVAATYKTIPERGHLISKNNLPLK